MIIDDEIIILKEIKYRDNDKILHALSRKNGKIQILAKGSRKNKSPLVNISQIMSYSKASLYLSKDMYIINNAELLDSFYNIRENIVAFMYSTYILELVSYISQENEVDTKIFDMTVKLFKIFNSTKDEKKIKNLIHVYEFKLSAMLGFRPQIKECLLCNKELSNRNKYHFRINMGGIICDNCFETSLAGYEISLKDILLMNKILQSKFEDDEVIFSIDNNIGFLIRKYLFHHIGKSNFTTLKLLENVNL